MSSTVTTLRAGASALLPIYPESFDDVVRLARMAIMAGMVAPITKGWGENQTTEPNDAVQARATMIILQGMELGIPPMQAVQFLAMINGRITAHSEAVPGLLLSKGFKIKQEFFGTPYDDDFAAVCTLTRPDGATHVSRFSVADAKEAGLWQTCATVKKKGKNGSFYDAPNDSPWWKYRKRMLWARALGFSGKDFASDALKGLMVREEMDDLIRSERAIDITPKPVAIEIPDIPDEIPDIPDAQEPEAQQEEPDTIADVKGFLKMISDRLKEGYSPADIYESFGEMAERLPEDARGKFDAMLEEAAE